MIPRKYFSLYIRILISLIIIATFLFLSIRKENQLIDLRLRIPKLQKEVNGLEEENQRLQYQIDTFQSSGNLLQLLERPEFGHLIYPSQDEIVILRESNHE